MTEDFDDDDVLVYENDIDGEDVDGGVAFADEDDAVDDAWSTCTMSTMTLR